MAGRGEAPTGWHASKYGPGRQDPDQHPQDQHRHERRAHERRRHDRRHPAEPHHRLRRSTRLRVLAIAILGLGGLYASWPAAHGELFHSRRQAKARELPLGYQLLVSTLDRLRRSWLPGDRDRLLEQLQERRADLEIPLLWVVERPSHPRFAETAALAAELHCEAALPALQDATASDHPKARAAALRAVDALQPLTDDELTDCLEDAMREVQLAGLEMLAARVKASPLLVVTALGLLASPDAAIRSAAFEALPDELPEEAASDLAAMVDDELAGALALQALGRLQPSEHTVAVLVDRLTNTPEEQQPALLAALKTMTDRPEVQELLWNLALADGPTTARASALRCLEAAGGDCKRLPADLADWPSTARYFAARLLLRGGHRQGLEVMLDLAELEESEHAYARASARMVLARLSNLPPHTDSMELRAWAMTLRKLPAAELPAAPPF